jgi:hypothetical protein
MLCFDFFSGGDIDILLCEETIRYTLLREEGLHLAATIVLKPRTRDARLQIVHPKQFCTTGLTDLAGWEGSRDVPFSYTSVFTDMHVGRFVRRQPGEYDWRELRWEQDTLVMESDAKVVRVFHKRPVEGELLGADDVEAPYTCLDVTGFPEVDQHFILRLEGQIIGKSYDELIDPDSPSGTRVYKIYGSSYVCDYIHMLFMPRYQRMHRGVGNAYATKIKDLIPTRRITPKVYSIAAIGPTDDQAGGVEPLDLTGAIVEITDKRNAESEADDRLRRACGSFRWFATRSASTSFFQQLVGRTATLATAAR